MSYRSISPVWKKQSKEIEIALTNWILQLNALIPKSGCDIFFRADDVGYPGKQFSAMIDVFRKHKVPLALAVVPCWINELKTSELFEELKPDENLWCLHQHGYHHKNTEKEGKKFEFGPSLEKKVAFKRLEKGRKKLKLLLGDKFKPIFTPPWNRCSAQTMECLVELGFNTISRSINVKPNPPAMLRDVPVNIDLHTRKESSPDESLKALLQEMSEAFQSGTAGFMLHHQRMNKRSFLFLDTLLPRLKEIKLIRFKTLDSF